MNPRKATFGTLSLLALGIGVLAGIVSTLELTSGAEEIASLGAALAGIGLGLIACVPSLIFAVIGLLRKERPLWPAVSGFILSAYPGGLGLSVLLKILADGFKHFLQI